MFNFFNALFAYIACFPGLELFVIDQIHQILSFHQIYLQYLAQRLAQKR